jgi:hypothetical protein
MQLSTEHCNVRELQKLKECTEAPRKRPVSNRYMYVDILYAREG